MSLDTDLAMRTMLAKALFQPCILCGASEVGAGLFGAPPEISGRFGAPPGKTRLIAYALCNACAAKPGCFERVEDELRRGTSPRRTSA